MHTNEPTNPVVHDQQEPPVAPRRVKPRRIPAKPKVASSVTPRVIQRVALGDASARTFLDELHHVSVTARLDLFAPEIAVKLKELLAVSDSIGTTTNRYVVSELVSRADKLKHSAAKEDPGGCFVGSLVERTDLTASDNPDGDSASLNDLTAEQCARRSEGDFGFRKLSRMELRELLLNRH